MPNKKHLFFRNDQKDIVGMNWKKKCSHRHIGVLAIALGVTLPTIGASEINLPKIRPNEAVLLARQGIENVLLSRQGAETVRASEVGKRTPDIYASEFSSMAPGLIEPKPTAPEKPESLPEVAKNLIEDDPHGVFASNQIDDLASSLPAVIVSPGVTTTSNLIPVVFDQPLGAYERSFEALKGVVTSVDYEAIRLAMVEKAAAEKKAFEGEEEMIPPPQINIQTSDVEMGTLGMARNKLINGILKDDSEGDYIVEYGRFLIGAMMLSEARSLLKDFEKEGVGNVSVLALVRAVELLDGSASPKRSTKFVWEESSVWEYLERIEASGKEPSVDDIKIGAQYLLEQSESIATAVLPRFFDQAVALENQELSRELLEIAVKKTDLSGTPELLYMQGQLALMEGERRAAFDFFAAVVGEPGLEGAEAVLSLSELALQRGSKKILIEVQDLLIEAAEDWRGDDVSLRVMARLAQVAEEIQDLPVAIEVMAKITKEFPGSKEAVLAERRLPVLIKNLAGMISEDDYSLEKAVSQVRRFGPKLQGNKDWAELRLLFAERLARTGLLEASAAEYIEIRKIISRISRASEQLENRVYVEHAEILSALGRESQAVEVLALVEGKSDPGIERRHILIGLQLDDPETLEKIDDLLQGNIEDAEILRSVARASMRSEDWTSAVMAYSRYVKTGSSLSRIDATNYAYAASIGDKWDEVASVEFGTDNSDLLVSSYGISRKMPVLQPLNEEKARTMLDRLDEVLLSIQEN
jgi:hypothetical protein